MKKLLYFVITLSYANELFARLASATISAQLLSTKLQVTDRPSDDASEQNTGVKVGRLNNGIVLQDNLARVLVSVDSLGSLRLTPATSSGDDVHGQRTSLSSSERFDAVFGIFKMPMGYTVVLAKESSPVALPGNSKGTIRRVTKFEFIDLATGDAQTNLPFDISTVNTNAFFKIALRSVIRRHHFYFSIDTATYNILATFQRNQEGHSLQSTAQDDAYFWNQNAMQPFVMHNYTSFITKFCSMWSSSFHMKVQGQSLHYVLLARRSKLQQGPRYIKRGCNDEGHVANFVEIEQIVAREDGTANSSFVQIRGSIPVHWSQHETWKLKPPIRINGDLNRDILSVGNHAKLLHTRYIKIEDTESTPYLYAINLIDKKGSQGRLGQQWLLASLLNQRGKSQNNDLFTTDNALNRSDLSIVDYTVGSLSSRYLWFDYHYKVKHEGVESLRQLYRHILPAITSARGGFYLSKLSRNSVASSASQYRLVRTNCVDCLDRTNVVQSLVARWALFQQITSLVGSGVSLGPSSALVLPNKEWEKNFRSVWGDLGDHLSSLYAGSNAMKRDVTRFGVRTNRGVLDDAMSFVKRYITNNYWDAAYQKALDLLIYNNNVDERDLRLETSYEASMNNTVDVVDVVDAIEKPELSFVADEDSEDSNIVYDRDDLAVLKSNEKFKFSDLQLQQEWNEKVQQVNSLFQELINDVKQVSNACMHKSTRRK